MLYSTHAPAFLNVARLEELVLVRHSPRRGTHVVQPQPLDADEAFRVVSEFDAERSELFLARSAILVEGRTEKLVLLDLRRARTGRRPRPGFDRRVRQVEHPGVRPHLQGVPDSVRGRPRPGRGAGEQPIPAEVELNRLIVSIAGRARTIVLEPDFEGVTGLRGHSTSPSGPGSTSPLPESGSGAARAGVVSLEPPAARGAGAGVDRRDEKPASRVRDSPMPAGGPEGARGKEEER